MTATHGDRQRGFHNRWIAAIREQILELPLEPILHPSSLRLVWLGLFILVGQSLFGWIWGYWLIQPYENIPLRIVMCLLGILLIIPRISQHPFSRLTSITFTAVFWLELPTLFTWMYLCNGANAVWLASFSAMLLIFYHVTDWRLATIGLVLCGGLVSILFHFVGPQITPVPTEQVLINAVVLAFSWGAAIVLGASSANVRQVHIANTRKRIETLTHFAGSVAHEMRNPLAQVKYSLDTVKNALPILINDDTAALSPSQSEELFQTVEQGLIAINRGERVIVNIMNEVSNKPIDPNTFAYSSAAQITQKAINESVEINDEKNRVFFKVVKDFTFKVEETLYLFILFNLIKNALYYFKDRPQARLTITVDGNTHSVKVHDTGPGIPADVRSRLFGSFVTSGKVDGTGLGLAYCKRTMQAFGGDITCASVVHEFTEFTLSFPPVSLQELQTYSQGRIEAARDFLQGKSVLLVDDIERMRKIVRMALQDFDCDIDEAENGQQAIERLKTKNYAITVLDLDMPILNGYTTAERIRSGIVPGKQNTPLLAYSGESSLMARMKAKKNGMNGFMSKSCTPPQLIDAMCQAIAHAAQNIPAKPLDVLQGKTIIVADDDPMNRRIIKAYLRDTKLTVLEAENGEGILDLLQKHSVSVVLTDMMMPPGMSGTEATRLIRAGAIQADVPIIALTANFNDRYIDETKAAGMTDFISKPIESNVLFAKLLIRPANSIKPHTSPMSPGNTF